MLLHPPHRRLGKWTYKSLPNHPQNLRHYACITWKVIVQYIISFQLHGGGTTWKRRGAGWLYWIRIIRTIGATASITNNISSGRLHLLFARRENFNHFRTDGSACGVPISVISHYTRPRYFTALCGLICPPFPPTQYGNYTHNWNLLHMRDDWRIDSLLCLLFIHNGQNIYIQM